MTTLFLGTRLNIGCGSSPIPGWINCDNSFSIRLAKRPILTFLLDKLGVVDENSKKFISTVKGNTILWVDATKKIPFDDNSVAVIYSSHMIEHFDRQEVRVFLREAHRVLFQGGVIRLVVPDLKKLVSQYLANGSAEYFMEKSLLGRQKPKTFLEKIRNLIIGDRHHFWMYDGKSLVQLLQDMEFQNVQIQEPGSTMIESPGLLPLDERVGNSVFVEAKKV